MLTLLFIVVVVVGIIYAVLRQRRVRASARTLPGLAEQAESTAQRVKEWLNSSRISNSFTSEKKALKAMEREYADLKQRYAGDTEKLWPLITDWWAYNDALMEIIHAREVLDTDSSTGAHDRYEEATKAVYAKKHEIEGRYLRSVQLERQKDRASVVENG